MKGYIIRTISIRNDMFLNIVQGQMYPISRVDLRRRRLGHNGKSTGFPIMDVRSIVEEY